MVTLFRRIREKLVQSGSLTKYLLYATGEILLVVVGILIALQVNNWNENRKTATEEQTLLAQLLEDLEFARIQSQQFIQLEKQNIDRLRLALGGEESLVRISQLPNRELFFFEVLWNLSHDIPVIVSYADLKNSGNT
ncbi:DUF6090 family protein [Rhodohalobacter mucosus]|uniref:Uncharacterized protein n=1 Tax=Rhodohalobacter mucosus TaxID=2079485 RepID=A0A316TLP0_9BACT|nr:DUF6090 family protein [Rhodohalobacter mucosus]PWN05487.1 hypothetical protein DDZ15_12825 [Rhodohalobacter mucosus]